jgi:hypothetical protein
VQVPVKQDLFERLFYWEGNYNNRQRN